MQNREQSRADATVNEEEERSDGFNLECLHPLTTPTRRGSVTFCPSKLNSHSFFCLAISIHFLARIILLRKASSAERFALVEMFFRKCLISMNGFLALAYECQQHLIGFGFSYPGCFR
jgi:hypothetical protein